MVNALSVVEEHMSHDPKPRRTGEPPIGHIYRGLLEAMDFVSDINKSVKEAHPITKQFRPLAFFTPRTATGLLLTYMLHDFCEDSFTYVDESGTPQEDREYGGYVHASPEINLVINSVVRPTSPNKYSPANEGATVLAQAVIPTDDVITSKVLRAIESLNIEKTDGNLLRKFVSDTILDRRQDTRLMPEQRLVDLFAILSKFFDRNDNLRTYPFKWDKENGQYVNVPPEKMLSKIDEVLSQFDPMNLLVFQVFAGRNPFKKLSSFMRADFIDTTYALTYRNILKYFPTRIAAHMLMGLTHDKIFKRSDECVVPKVR